MLGRAFSLKDQLAEDLGNAYTDEEREQVLQLWEYKFMFRGYKQETARRAVMRLLHQIEGEF